MKGEQKEYYKKWLKRNPNYHSKRYKLKKKQINDYWKKWSKDNKEHWNNYLSKYRDKNRERYNQIAKNWRQNNPEQSRKHSTNSYRRTTIRKLKLRLITEVLTEIEGVKISERINNLQELLDRDSWL